MKKFIHIVLLLCSLPLITLGQSDFDYMNSGMEENDPTHAPLDTVERPDVKHVRKTWQWAREGVYREEIPLDTVLDGIQNFNYIFKRNISNTYLGNFPSPYESNIFITREATQDFYPETYVRAFLYKPEDAVLFNTTTPFTRLKYFTGGGKGKAENLLDIWHVQNIKPFWSAGFRYNLISSDGRYMNQKAKTYNFSAFSSYEKERLAISFFLNQNVGHFDENGGIKDKTYITDSTDQKAENIPINLSNNVSNNVRNFNFATQFHYNMGNRKMITDSLRQDTSYTYPAKVVVDFRIEDNERWFKENSINFDFYPNTYIDSTQSYDLISNRIYNFSGKLVLNEHPKLKYLPGIYAGLDFQYENYRQRTDFDSVTRSQSYGKDKYTGTYITGGLFSIDTNTLLNYDVAARLCLIGHYAGNFKVDGYVRQALRKDRTSYLQANATFELKNVNPFFSRYVGNHDIWENDFKAIKTLAVTGKYVNTKLRTELGAGVTNIYSYAYFDTTAMPVQTSKTLLVFTAWVKEKFRAGKFWFDQTVYFQKSNHEDVLALPALSLYSHNYYQNNLFKKALLLQAGIDVFYNTKFYADNYMPSTMQFYNQREWKTGNHPRVDVFIAFRIKRADLFLKYEHLNYYLKNHGNFFSAADYPINPAVFKFGLKWDFFD